MKEIVKNHSKINCVKYHIHTENGPLCFNKKSTNQTFTFTSSKVIYFKKHLTQQVQRP